MPGSATGVTEGPSAALPSDDGTCRGPVFEDLLRLIDQFGWAVQNVGAGAEKGEAAFSYTVGLTAMGHPEVVATGLPFNVALTFLNDMGQEVVMARSSLPAWQLRA